VCAALEEESFSIAVGPKLAALLLHNRKLTPPRPTLVGRKRIITSKDSVLRNSMLDRADFSLQVRCCGRRASNYIQFIAVCDYPLSLAEG
jgi:hypothetical protein